MPTVCSTSKSKVNSLQGINHRKCNDKLHRKKIVKGEDEHVTWTLNPKYPKQKKEEQIKIVPNKKTNKQRPSTSNYTENDTHNVTTKNKKINKVSRNRTTMKPSCGIQTMEKKATKVDKNMKKATSARFINFYHDSRQSIDDLNKFFLSSLLEPEENNGDNNNDLNKELGLLKKIVDKISCLQFVYGNTNDICTNNRHGKYEDKKIFKANKSSSWNKKKDTTSRICESTATKGLLQGKSKTDDLTKKCVPASLDCTKVKKTKRSKTQIASNLLSDVYDYGLDTNLNKNTCKNVRLSGITKNPIGHKVICVYKTEIESYIKPSYDKQVKSMPKASNEKVDNNCSINVNAIKKTICKTNVENDDVKNEIYDDYLDANSENATTIWRNNYENVVTEAENDDYSDYISWKTCSCKSKTEIEQFVEACDLVFDKFTDILFDTVTSDYNTNLQISSSVTLKSTGEC